MRQSHRLSKWKSLILKSIPDFGQCDLNYFGTADDSKEETVKPVVYSITCKQKGRNIFLKNNYTKILTLLNNEYIYIYYNATTTLSYIIPVTKWKTKDLLKLHHCNAALKLIL